MSLKKASELMFLNDLELSGDLIDHIKTNKQIPLAELVLMCRATAYYQDRDSRAAKNRYPLWRVRLTEALDKAGYIRHDFNEVSFRIGDLYKDVFAECKEDFVGLFDNLRSNEAYENYHVLTRGQVESVKITLRQILTKDEYAYIVSYYGLTDGKRLTVDKIAINLKADPLSVRSGLESAKKKMIKGRSLFPRVFYSVRINQDINGLIEELTLLQLNPIFTEAKLLGQRIREMTALPFVLNGEAKEYAECTVNDLDRLYLDLCTLSRLQNHGINTIANLIDFPEENWKDVGLSVEEKKALEKKMRDHGVVDFGFLYEVG